jgi:phosphoadenosine phosphosulfate reductase
MADFGSRFGTDRAARLAALRRDWAGLDGPDLVRAMIEGPFAGRIAVTSSFGIEAAVTLHLVARVDRATPVLVLDTGFLFPETRAYAETLIERLRLSDVRTLRADADALRTFDPGGTLHRADPDRCCHIRKVRPLDAGLDGFEAWITGRKRIHGGARAALEPIEDDGRLFKINPLADWSAARVQGHFDAFALPRHPLQDAGYASVGCAPCTRPPDPGESARAGRWSGASKTECGIHRAA